VAAIKRLPAGESVSYHRLYAARGEERIALLAVGYGDGLPLALSNRGRVLVRGRAVPVRGAVCMDVTIVDATPFPDLEPGEVATLIGRQGAASRSVVDVARESGLTSYAVFTGITARVARRYRKGDQDVGS
jgi:alanine racemase